HYDVYYRVYTPIYGWLGWAKNGAVSGTTELANRLEGIQVVLVAKGGAAPGDVGGIKSVLEISEIKPTTPILPGSGLFKMGTGAKVSYAVKSSAGWSSIKSDGEVLEVSGPVTGIAVGLNIPKHKLHLFADVPNFAGEYEDDNDGDYDISCSLNIIDAGTRIESIRMYMTTGKYNEVPEDFNLFYRVKTSGNGWMAWTHYSEDSDDTGMCGTDEVGNTISAIQIIVLPAGQTPAKDLNGITSDCEKSFLTMADFPAPYLVTTNNKFAKWCLKTFPAKYRDPVFGLFSESKGWKYKFGGSSKKGCDCSGFVVYVMRSYFHKRVYHGMYKLSHKIGKNISYSKMRPGDWLCDWSYHHGWVSFYVGKDNYGHEVVLTGYVENNKVIPRLEYWDVKAWLSEPKHSLRRK
ncbi:MAG: C40 family peptidase, partial [Saccharofermentans sp.]|nr:C40 family peptidase [Saccharofermentans sp.]